VEKVSFNFRKTSWDVYLGKNSKKGGMSQPSSTGLTWSSYIKKKDKITKGGSVLFWQEMTVAINL